ncbi:MAG: EamA family transporter [Chloroflexota bacterium]|nr:EamA family transporter [Chloroflexota bacterium]
MNWANTAILAAAILAVVNILDSYLITKRFPSLRAFLLPVGIVALIYGSAIFIFVPLPENVDLEPIIFALISSVVRVVGIMMFLYAMQTEEVSRIMPVVNINPVFVALLAVLFLGETLETLEWLAIVITVCGAVLISMKQVDGSHRLSFNGLMALPFVSALCMATGNLASKYALEDISFWNMYAISALVLGIVTVFISLRPRVLAELRSVHRPVCTMWLLVLNETLAPIAIILLFWSIERGPVSLVSTIAGTQPVFIFIYALILSRVSSMLLEQRMEGKTLILKLISIAMIVGGITIIQLT